MHIDAFICDAITMREGLLHVLGGGITTLTRSEFPTPLAISLAAVLTAEAPGTYEVSVTIKREGSDEEVFKVDGPIRAIGGGTTVEDGVVVPFPVGFIGTRIPAPGKYLIDIAVNGQSLRTLWFRVREPSSAGLSGPAQP
ncbi:MAG: hypothetical protein ABI548_01705 [Polyangiaceae bacterium]